MNSSLVVLSSFPTFLFLPLFQLFPTINRLLCKVSVFSAILTSVIRLVLFFHLNLSRYLDAKESSTIHLPNMKQTLKGALMLTVLVSSVNCSTSIINIVKKRLKLSKLFPKETKENNKMS